jgi:hypothetical protein
LEFAKGVSDEKSLLLLMTFYDALVRQQERDGFNTYDLAKAMERGDWNTSLDLTVDIALTQGADQSLLINALSQRCEDLDGAYNTVASNGNGVLTNGIEMNGIELEFRDKNKHTTDLDDGSGGLLALLHDAATENARAELAKALEELDRVNKVGASQNGSKGAFGPGYSPFSKAEEIFFVRNQINNAVQQKSLVEIRRALNHAVTLGINAASFEIEAAYRDALTRYHSGAGLSPGLVLETLERGEWWSALDDVVGASLSRGGDKYSILKNVARVCATPGSMKFASRSASSLISSQSSSMLSMSNLGHARW